MSAGNEQDRRVWFYEMGRNDRLQREWNGWTTRPAYSKNEDYMSGWNSVQANIVDGGTA